MCQPEGMVHTDGAVTQASASSDVDTPGIVIVFSLEPVSERLRHVRHHVELVLVCE